MSLWNPLSSLLGKAVRPLPYRPRLEALEARELPSTCTVDRLTDKNPTAGGEGGNGMGDLRYCITNATDGDDIQFGVTGTINLTGALPDLAHSIGIDGPGANLLTVRRDTGGDYRIFTVSSAVTVGISGLTITGGTAFTGSGILNGGTLTLSFSTVSSNANLVLNASGGGIYNSGSLTVINSTIALNNVGDSRLGGAGGGIYNSGSLTVINSTIAWNTALRAVAGGAGGGILNNSVAGTVTVVNSTLALSTAVAGFGGGILGPLNMRNTVLAGNTAAQGRDLFGSLTSSGYNLIGNTQGGSGYADTDLLNVNPMLGPLADNGGPTFTLALLPGSPAIDAGGNTGAPMWDQRGAPFHRIVNGIIDIGAFEVQARGHGGPTRQPLPDPVPVQGLPDSPSVGQPPDLPADPSLLPGTGARGADQPGTDPVPVPTAGGQLAAEASFTADAGDGQPGDPLGLLAVIELPTLGLSG